MTVDSAQNVTSQIRAQSVGQVNLPVGPGDLISGAPCLDTKPPGTAHYSSPTRPDRRRYSSTRPTGPSRSMFVQFSGQHSNALRSRVRRFES
jgi:hypothetical protein